MPVDANQHPRKAFLKRTLAGLPLSDKIATGLGFVIGLLFCAVIIAGLGTHAARSSADAMKTRHLPFMETALSLERLVYEAVFHVSMFGITGDMASYSGARIQFPDIRAMADRLTGEAMGLPEGHTFARDMEVLRDLAEQLNMVVEKKRTLNDELAAEQAKLQKTAGDMGEILLDLQARVASARAAKETDVTLDEKARLLVLNGFSLAVAEVTGRVLAAGVARNAEDMAKAQAYFTVRWEEARDACAEAAALGSHDGTGAARTAKNPADRMDSLVAAYAEILGTIRFNLEESARIALDRISITGRLTALARGIVAASRASMVAAADSTDTALRGATATLFACALLACILAVGAAIAFVRSRPSS